MLAQFQRKYFPYLLLIFIALVVNFNGITRGFFTDDPGLYALISKNMAQSGNYSSLIFFGEDWLDKPHFQYWATAPFISIFGATPLAYKLPSFLFFCFGLVYLFILGKTIHSYKIGFLAVFLLLSSVHIMLSNEDIRAETMLLGCMIPAMYYLLKLMNGCRLLDILLAALFLALSTMIKGPVVLIPYFFGVVLSCLFTRQYELMFSWRWVALVALFFVFLFPEIYSLYLQFDSQPEKVVFGEQGVSGIKWFLFDSQFSRFKGEGPITRIQTTPLDYLFSVLWSYAPWIFLLVPASVYIFQYKPNKGVIPQKAKLLVLFCGSVCFMIIVSFSKFQLPHYSNMIYPFLSLIIAFWVTKTKVELGHYFEWVLLVITTLIFVLLGYSTNHFQISLLILTGVALLYFLLFIFFREDLNSRVVLFLGGVFLAFNVWICSVYYSERIRLSPTSDVSEYIESNYSDETIYTLDTKKVPSGYFYAIENQYAKISPYDLVGMDSVYTLMLQGTYFPDSHDRSFTLDTINRWKVVVSERMDLGLVLHDEQEESVEWLFLVRWNARK